MKLIYQKDITTRERNWQFWCPACRSPHRYRVVRGTATQRDGKTPAALWTFNGNADKPSFTPSLLYYSTNGKWEGDKWVEGPKRSTICHLFLTDGVLNYCSDCPHEYAGKSVELPEYPIGGSEWR